MYAFASQLRCVADFAHYSTDNISTRLLFNALRNDQTTMLVIYYCNEKRK